MAQKCHSTLQWAQAPARRRGHLCSQHSTGTRTRGTRQDRPRSVRGATLLQVRAAGRARSGLHRPFLWRQRSQWHWHRCPGCGSSWRAGDRRRCPGADSSQTDPGEHLEVYCRHHAHDLWHVLVGGELRHQLAILRPVSAAAGCPLPGRIGTADHGHHAAKAACGEGLDDIPGNHALSREGGATMNIILKAILAVYNFFVGDLVILLGVTLLMVILALIYFLGALAALRGGSGIILIVGVLATLMATLDREVMRPENRQKA